MRIKTKRTIRNFSKIYLVEKTSTNSFSSPCAFLGGDNYCSIYEVRPKACREYPHTDRKNMAQVLNLTYRNTMVCPAVAEIVEHIKKEVQ